MKLILVTVLMAAAMPLSAGETAIESLRAVSFDMPAAAVPEAPAPAEPKEVKPDGLYRAYCWGRAPHAKADAEGMPASFCVSSFQVQLRPDSSAFLVLAGELSGEFPMQVKFIGDGLYAGTAAVFRRYQGAACTEGTDAVIEITVKMDARGAIIEEPSLKAFYGSTSDVCHSGWDYAEIFYLRR
ncbi:MAG TPA: hypothetical protein PKK31_03255 [Elusimicrobiales bacterium]|nr:hypothetical protein [Elusimicrobiales bacterium]